MISGTKGAVRGVSFCQSPVDYLFVSTAVPPAPPHTVIVLGDNMANLVAQG